jgi:hypothetical protein
MSEPQLIFNRPSFTAPFPRADHLTAMNTCPSKLPKHLSPPDLPAVLRTAMQAGIEKTQRPEPESTSLRLSHLCGTKFGFLLLVSLLSVLCPSLFAAQPPELTVLRQQYDKVIAERVTAPFDASLTELNTKYSAGLDRAMADAKAAGKLEDILAIEAEKKRLADKLPIPTTDDDKEPESLKRFRGIYRQQFEVITASRDKTQADLLPPYTAKLQQLEATLVKNDRVDEAKEVLAYRQGLGTAAPAAAAPAVAASTTPVAPPSTAPMPATEAPKVKGDDRKAAEWILSNWSEFRLFIDNHKGVSKTEGLPKGKFTIESIAIDGRFYTGGTLTGEALKVLAGLQELKSLTMGNFPDLKDEDFGFISTLSALDEFKLSKMNCTDAFLEHLKSLKKLRKLEFGELSKLAGTGFAQLADLPALNSIIHWKGGMTDAGIAAIRTLPSISILDFQSSPAVTDACIPSLRAMEKLATLLLSATNLTPEGFVGIDMPKIKTLGANELGKLQLSQIAPKMAAAFPSIDTYAFSYYARTLEDLASLAHYKKLKKFHYAGSINDEVWPALLELRELESFRTYSNEMTPALWQTLAKLKKLKSVYYGNKPPNAAAIAAFKKERPDVKVEP